MNMESLIKTRKHESSESLSIPKKILAKSHINIKCNLVDQKVT